MLKKQIYTVNQLKIIFLWLFKNFFIKFNSFKYGNLLLNDTIKNYIYNINIFGEGPEFVNSNFSTNKNE